MRCHKCFPYLGHKEVPHAELGRYELLPVGGPLNGHWWWGGRCLLDGTSRHQHPHVEPAPLSVHILHRGLDWHHWGEGWGEGIGWGWRRSMGLNIFQAAADFVTGTFLWHTASAAFNTNYKQKEPRGQGRVSLILKQETREETDTRDGVINKRLILAMSSVWNVVLE